MSLIEEFGTTLSVADFLCAHWRPEHCEQKKWEKPSTHGIDGVKLVGKPHMELFIGKTVWKNPGRRAFKQSDVIYIADKIKTEGIIPSRVIYYDVDTNELINGIHRRGAAEILNISGWMMQGVRFSNKLAKIRFANASNHVEGLHHNEPTKEDVREGVREALGEIGEFDKKTIREEVRIQGPGLTDKQKDDIVNTLYSDCIFNKNMKTTERYLDLNNDNVEALFKIIREKHKTEEPWVTNYYDNDDEFTICINAKNFESRIGALLNIGAKATLQDKPLHIIFPVSIPEGKETLTSKREKFFSMHLESLEDRILELQGKAKTDKNRRDFPWNHPDCQHRAIAQDTENEETIPLIIVKNRKFN